VEIYSGSVVKFWNSEGCTILKRDKNMADIESNNFVLTEEEKHVIAKIRKSRLNQINEFIISHTAEEMTLDISKFKKTEGNNHE